MPLFGGIWLLSFTLSGCPPRETEIEVSPNGAAILVNACGPPPLDVTNLCDGLTATCEQAGAAFGPACRNAEQECRDLEVEQAAATCFVPGLGRPPAATTSFRMAARIALVSAATGEPVVEASSACATVPFNCPTSALEDECTADAINAAIADSIPPGGLGFDGLEESEDAIPVLLAFWDDDGDGDVSCKPSELFACGALDKRLTGDQYDLVCASCQSGPNPAVDSAPCVDAPMGGCFLGICAGISVVLGE